MFNEKSPLYENYSSLDMCSCRESSTWSHGGGAVFNFGTFLRFDTRRICNFTFHENSLKRRMRCLMDLPSSVFLGIEVRFKCSQANNYRINLVAPLTGDQVRRS